MVDSGNVDVITGDWLSEMNIAWNAIEMQTNPDVGFEDGFYTQLEGCIDDIVARGIKVVTNAGALNTLGLTRKVRELCKERGHSELMVASVLGDDVSKLVCQSNDKMKFTHLDHPERLLAESKLKPVCANAYIGCRGIVEALNKGASVVICGRVTDASPVMGAAAWYFGWAEHSFNSLAGALVAGHLIECGSYVVGANFSGFKSLQPGLVDLAFPVAEIYDNGVCIITRTPEGGGSVTSETVKAQLLYELQGHLYLNPDVVADLSAIRVEGGAGGADRVRVEGALGLPPPDTTKVMFAAPGGYQAEATFFINGLDVVEKTEMMRNQLLDAFKGHNFSKLSIELYGTPATEPSSQQEGTVFLRVFAQARERSDIDAKHFKIPVYALRMQSYPGYHMSLDFRTMDPKPFMEIFPALISQSVINQTVDFGDGPVQHVTSPTLIKSYSITRPSYETANPHSLLHFGPTARAPLGSIVHARSGDKADNSNIGFFVRHEDEYSWLQSFMTVQKLKELLGKDWFAGDTSRRVERVEFPNIWAVHL
jgi:hypothetical protein